MPANPDHLSSTADVVSSTAIEGTIRVKLGDAITGQGYAEAFLWSPPGFYGRPADPDAAGCSQAWYVGEGNSRRAIGFRDRRAQKILPQIQPGEAIMFGQQGQFVRTRNDGAVLVSTTDDGTINGRSIYVKTAPNGVEINTPWARVNVGANGIDAFHVSGATLTMGSVAGVPGALGDALNAAGITSYAAIDAGMVAINAGILSLGTDGGAGNEAAVTALKTLATAINTALVTISTTPCAVGNPVLTPAQAALVTTALNAFIAIASAIGKVV